ncbi:MAG: glycosyl transferase [Bacteroidales bacterium]|nr:glycosyl transferase [Bacteroidales bacterium]
MKQFGHFDDAAREYVITSPATPWPWINYLGTDGFFSLISNTAGGYCFYRDAKFRRITRYRYNDVPMDSVGRYFYVKEGSEVWSPGWKPCKTALDFYECRHGMGYTRITGEKDGLSVSELFFVPVGKNCEIQQVTLKNNSSVKRSFKLFAYTEWCLWNGQTDGENFQRNLSTGEVEIEPGVLYHKTEYKERRNHYAFYYCSDPKASYDTDRESFVGLYNGLDAPEAVTEGKCRKSVAHGWSPIAAFELDIVLEPGETAERTFMIGYIENPEDEKFDLKAPRTVWSPTINKKRTHELIAAFDSPAKVADAFAELGRYWDNILGRFSIQSDSPELDRMVNIWNQYQCMITFCFSRSASFFESGIGRGMGFRDSNQDLVGFVHQIPARARERILDIAATQFPDGGCYHQYQPLTKRGNNDIGGGFGDDPLWLIFGTVAYIKETGDFSILDEMVPFDNKPGSEKTLLEHLRISFDHVASRLGPHGLPLIGRADWNDCLNLNCFSSDPNESFQTTENNSEGSKAESLMIAGQFVFCGRQYAELLERLGLSSEHVRSQVDAMVAAVEQFGWDGRWFLRAYDFHGGKVGSDECEEGKIFIESQGWCTMAGIGAEKGMCAMALDSAKEMLDCEYGLVLNNPAFTRYYIEYGEISTYPAGYKENAGIFCHNNPWVIIGEVVAGRAEDAWDHYRKICPAFVVDQERRKVEPYVYCQMVAGKDAALPGEGKNSWLTGTAAWNWYTATQWILGIKPEYDGLRVKPCLPASIREVRVRKVFRDAVYDIVLKRTGHGPADGTFIPYQPGEHTVTVEF